MSFIPYGKQNINQQDIDAVVSVLQSDFLTQGPVINHFENRVAEYCGAKHGVAANSATSALHLACLALGLGEGDILWTSPNTFVASANVALLCGAKVDFVDIETDSYNLSVTALEQKLLEAKSAGKLPKIVMPVHFAGQSCDMVEIAHLAKEYGFHVIEDASHAIGADYSDGKVGNCRYSDITVFSFHPVKIVTTAEGGLATTNQAELAEKMQLLRSHGVTRDVNLMNKDSEGDWYYQQIDLGLNYRMTEMQAALGLSQMDRLDQFVERRHAIAKVYLERLAELNIQLPIQKEGRRSALHLFPLQLKNEQQRRQVFDLLRQAGLGVNVHYIPVHTQPYYQNLGFQPLDFPNAENYYARAISIPLHHSMSDEDVETVIQKLQECLT